MSFCPNIDVFLFQEERLDTHKLIPKAPKSMTQARLTSLYGNSMGKPDNQRKTSMNNQESASDECVVVERSHGFGFGTKRAHPETSSLANDGDLKADGAASGFVTAKTKLVEGSLTNPSFRVFQFSFISIFRRSIFKLALLPFACMDLVYKCMFLILV